MNKALAAVSDQSQGPTCHECFASRLAASFDPHHAIMTAETAMVATEKSHDLKTRTSKKGFSILSCAR